MLRKCLFYYGYSKVRDEDHIYYNNYDYGLTITFYLVTMEVKFTCYDTDLAFAVNIDELRAVFEQMRELGWC